MSYSCIENGYPGEGNIDADPDFVSLAGNNLRLNLGSPCNDTGSNDLVPQDAGDLDGDTFLLEPTPLDRALLARFTTDATNTPFDPCSALVDMGAYENGDCDADGIRDEDDEDSCPLCCLLDIVFIVDTSGSVIEELPEICELIAGVQADLDAQAVDTSILRLGIHEATICLDEAVDELYGGDPPGDEPDDDAGTFNDCPPGAENWGNAASIVAGFHPWQTPRRFIVTFSDEGPHCGLPCDDPGPDREAIENAVQVCQANDVIVFPVTTDPDKVDECTRTLADELGMRTCGEAIHVDENTTFDDVRIVLVHRLAKACCPWDLDDDGNVGPPDLALLLGVYWGSYEPCPPPCSPADFNRDCSVNSADLAQLLGNWGLCPNSNGDGAGSGVVEVNQALNTIGFDDVAQFTDWAESAPDEEVQATGWLIWDMLGE